MFAKKYNNEWMNEGFCISYMMMRKMIDTNQDNWLIDWLSFKKMDVFYMLQNWDSIIPVSFVMK